MGSSVAFRLAPKPMLNLLLSPGTGVPPWEDVSTAVEDIREKPGLGAGDPDALGVKTDGPGLPPLASGCTCGTGRVRKPASCLAKAFFPSRFFFVFSVLPLASGWASKNSAA